MKPTRKASTSFYTPDAYVNNGQACMHTYISAFTIVRLVNGYMLGKVEGNGVSMIEPWRWHASACVSVCGHVCVPYVTVNTVFFFKRGIVYSCARGRSQLPFFGTNQKGTSPVWFSANIWGPNRFQTKTSMHLEA